MADKAKLNVIKQNIAEKSKELEAMKAERNGAGDDLQKQVDLDVRIESMQESISALRGIVKTIEASEKIPEPHSALYDLLSGAHSYVAEKQKKVEKVERDIVETNAHLAETEVG